MEYTLKANNELEGYDLIKTKGIEASPEYPEGENEVVATIYDIGSFEEYLKSVSGVNAAMLGEVEPCK